MSGILVQVVALGAGALLFTTPSPGPPQQAPARATSDLSSLLGRWEIERKYDPGAENERTLSGTLNCREALGEAFIRCAYEFVTPGKKTAHEEVSFNYNAIYKRYEALWFSSTWPIKVLMQGSLKVNRQGWVLEATAQFPIEGGVIEFVRSEHRFAGERFEYRVDVRTSEGDEGAWRHHMQEVARRISP